MMRRVATWRGQAMPKQTYLLVYSHLAGTYEEVREFINSQPEIVDWFYCLPNSFLIVSELDAEALSDLFQKFTNKQARYLILNTNTDRQGWLPNLAWAIMRNPRSSDERHAEPET